MKLYRTHGALSLPDQAPRLVPTTEHLFVRKAAKPVYAEKLTSGPWTIEADDGSVNVTAYGQKSPTTGAILTFLDASTFLREVTALDNGSVNTLALPRFVKSVNIGGTRYSVIPPLGLEDTAGVKPLGEALTEAGFSTQTTKWADMKLYQHGYASRTVAEFLNSSDDLSAYTTAVVPGGFIEAVLCGLQLDTGFSQIFASMQSVEKGYGSGVNEASAVLQILQIADLAELADLLAAAEAIRAMKWLRVSSSTANAHAFTATLALAQFAPSTLYAMSRDEIVACANPDAQGVAAVTHSNGAVTEVLWPSELLHLRPALSTVTPAVIDKLRGARIAAYVGVLARMMQMEGRSLTPSAALGARISKRFEEAVL